MTDYQLIGAIGLFLIVAGLGYLMWEITREARR
jgi:hypothetical protein